MQVLVPVRAKHAAPSSAGAAIGAAEIWRIGMSPTRLLTLGVAAAALGIVTSRASAGCDDGSASDCNLNGTVDSCDIAGGTSGDCNTNGVPDECDLAGPLEITERFSTDSAFADRFGYAIAVSGQTAVIGAFSDSHVASFAGSAYIFRLISGDWQQTAKLTASDAALYDNFGTSVSIDGATVLIGASGNNDAGDNSGSAYIFQEVTGVWSQMIKLTAADAAAGDKFGSRVALSGNTAVVTAPNDDDAGSSSGSAYVFRSIGGVWQQISKLTASDAAAFDLFGADVSFDGISIVIGAHAKQNARGAAYVFRELGPGSPSWQQVAKLSASDAQPSDYFGFRLALADDAIVVGAPQGDIASAGNSGAAYVFRDTGSAWQQVQKLTAPDAAGGDYFGGAVAVNGDTLIIGASLDTHAVTEGGSAYVFRKVTDYWLPSGKLTASDPIFEHKFGLAVAVADDSALIGAPGDSDHATQNGSAYHFALNQASLDCDGNAVPDECDLAAGSSADCNANLVPDACEIAAQLAADCNLNAIPDDCDLAAGLSTDCNLNSIPDECDVLDGHPDCNGDGLPDECFAAGDVNADGFVDSNDHAAFAACLAGPEVPVAPACCLSDLDGDGDNDLRDFARLQRP
jgi:hypothetical protein